MKFGTTPVMPMFRKTKAEVGPTACSTSAAVVSFISSTTYGQNFPVTIECLVGDIHYSALSTAPTTTFPKMVAGDVKDLLVLNALALVSTSTGATYQATIWER